LQRIRFISNSLYSHLSFVLLFLTNSNLRLFFEIFKIKCTHIHCPENSSLAHQKLQPPIMKKLFVFSILLFTNLSFAQSKKEQIAELSQKLDSIANVLNTYTKLLKEKDSILMELNVQKSKTEHALKTVTQEKEKLIKENNAQKQSLEKLNEENGRKEANLKALKMKMDSISLKTESSLIFPQTTTDTYAGSYSFEYENGPQGSLDLYFKNGLYYFNLEYVKGPPSYNMGTLTGQMKLFGNHGVLSAKLYDEAECKIVFLFDDYGVHVKQQTSDSDCGFGFGVIINEYYFKDTSENNPIDLSEGELIKSTNRW
jgi:hypothetical protein